MELVRCACGCGKVIENPKNAQKFYDDSHRRRCKYLRDKGIFPVEEKKQEDKKKKTTPEQRWREMSNEELSAECARMHKTYGQVQSMYYNGTLPEDFGMKK